MRQDEARAQRSALILVRRTWRASAAKRGEGSIRLAVPADVGFCMKRILKERDECPEFVVTFKNGSTSFSAGGGFERVDG